MATWALIEHATNFCSIVDNISLLFDTLRNGAMDEQETIYRSRFLLVKVTFLIWITVTNKA